MEERSGKRWGREKEGSMREGIMGERGQGGRGRRHRGAREGLNFGEVIGRLSKMKGKAR